MSNRIVKLAGGMKISAPGYNVLTTGQENLLFDTNYSGLGVYQTGIVSIPASTGEAEQIYTVNYASLGYTPMAAYQWWTSGSVVYGGGGWSRSFYDEYLDGAGDPQGIHTITHEEGDGLVGRGYSNKLEIINTALYSITCRYVVFYQRAF